MVNIPGSWSSFDHLEESLTLDELVLLQETVSKKVSQDRRFAASLKGIDIPEEEDESKASFEEVERRAKAKLANISEEEMEFSDIGFGFIGGDA